MNRAYPNKINWTNEPSHTTPIDENNLGLMDEAIYVIDGRVVELHDESERQSIELDKKVDKYETITTPTDLNTILESGFYSIPDGCTNKPSGMSGGGKGTLIVVAHPYGASSGRVLQILVNQLNVNSTDKMYYRIGTIGTQTASFLDWNRVLNLDDIPTIASAIKQWNTGTYTIDLYGIGLPDTYYPASSTYSGDKYLDVATGKMYDCLQTGASTYTWRQAPVVLQLKSDINASTIEDIQEDISTSLTATGNPITIESSESNLVECVATISSSTSTITITVKDKSTNPTVTNTYTIDLGRTVSSGTLDIVKGTLTTGGTTYNLPPTQIKLLKGNNVISTNVSSLSIKYYPDNVLGQLKGDIEDEYDERIEVLEEKVDVRTAKVYSFHINDSESNPSDKVTYLDDAVGMTPAHMNFTTGKFDYGSWGNVWFVKECKPCILGQDGKVYKYLNPNNYGTDVDILDSDPYNVMIEFPKIWYKVTPDANDSYSGTVSISSVKIDEGYKDYAYIDYKGNHKEHFYMPAYNGSLVNNVIRSLSYKQVSKSLNAQTEINYCRANGSGWYTEDAGEIMLINFLLILMGKSTDMQSVYGQGLHTGGTEAINNSFTTGVHNNKGLFYGTNSGTIASGSYGNAVKVFGIENYWGFQWRRYAGDINDNGTRKIKLCYGNEDGSTSFDYDSGGAGYVDVGATPSGTTGGYISKMKFAHDGMYSQVSSGSSSTYYCDGQWFNNSQVDYAFRGGYSRNGLLVGAFCVYLDHAASRAWWDVGAAPSYK